MWGGHWEDPHHVSLHGADLLWTWCIVAMCLLYFFGMHGMFLARVHGVVVFGHALRVCTVHLLCMWCVNLLISSGVQLSICLV